MRREIKEYDIVALKEDLPDQGLPRGTRGTVLEIFQEPRLAYLVEFFNEQHLSLGVPIVEASALELVDAQEGGEPPNEDRPPGRGESGR